jgi:hypothetical protein
MRNPTYDPIFTSIKQLRLQYSPILAAARDAGDPMPANANGTNFCLAYHINGDCFTDCARKEDHRVHTATEQSTLAAWVRKHFVKKN